MTAERCKSCPATFVWGMTEKRRSIPLDAEPDATGRWVPVEDPAGNIEPTGEETWGRNGDLVPLVRALRKDEIAQASMTPRWRSHFATCPKAGDHSRARRRGRGGSSTRWTGETPAHARTDLPVSAQSPYQGTLTATMDALGWKWNHTRPVYDRAAQSYITPTTAKGWPDLAAVHPRAGVMLFAELKGKCPAPKRGWSISDVRPEQLDWLRYFHTVPCAAAVVLRPTDDWTTISGWLANPETIVSGYGWLPPEEHHRVWTSRSISRLLA